MKLPPPPRQPKAPNQAFSEKLIVSIGLLIAIEALIAASLLGGWGFALLLFFLIIAGVFKLFTNR